jgi:predicted transglutaminase-like cysteine proteinase
MAPTRHRQSAPARAEAECAIDPAEPEIIWLDQTALELIQAVNQDVNRSIIPRRDIEH